MTDIHTHLLPDMDNGPRTFDESMQLVEMEVNDGVDTIAVTPHFNFEFDRLDEFLEKRARQSETLRKIITDAGLAVSIVEGAEVSLSQWITVEQAIKRLCYLHTSNMLVELPSDFFPDWAPQVLSDLHNRGITPVLAHVERYSYFQKNSEMLRNLVQSGCLAQLNADSLVSRGFSRRAQAISLLKSGLVQVLASDTHSVFKRPPRLGAAMKLFSKVEGRPVAELLDATAGQICNGADLLRAI